MFCRPIRSGPSLPALLLFLACASILAPRAAAQVPGPWVELKSAHFTVYTNGGEKTAARIAVQFEQIRDVFTKISRNLRVDPGQPIVILAAKDEKSLAALLPEYYSAKDRVHPAGIFIPRAERNYIVLRANVDSDLPFATLYHEYTHQVTDLNAAFMPTWFSEGYAEFFGYSRIVGRRVSIGWAPEGGVYFLQQSRLMPLEELFRVDHRSPYYNEGKKANVFYAQSWALIHMLFMAPEFRESDRLSAYLSNVNQGLDPVEAARRAFGDLQALQKRLESYIRAGSYFHYEMNSPIEEIEKSFAVRSPSEAETAAVLGTYHISHEQRAEGQKLLERALQLEPDLVAANEALGMMYAREQEFDKATPYIERAVQLNSQSFLTYFYHGNLLLQSQTPDASAMEDAAASYTKCVALNRNFAPAHAALARIYSRRDDTLDQALQSARTAVALEPGEWSNQLAVAVVLARRGEFAEARTIAERVAANAAEPEEANAAASALTFIDDTEKYQAERRRYEESRRQIAEARFPSDPVTLVRRPEIADDAERPPATNTETAEAPPTASGASRTGPATTPTRRAYSMRGRIIALDCSAAPKVALTLSLGGLSMKLMTSDFSQVALSNDRGEPERLRCEQLRGTTARILYTLTPGEPYDGEFHSVSLQPLVP